MNAHPIAEQAALGSLLLDSRLMPEVTPWLRPGDFAEPWHREVYTAMRECHAAGVDGGAVAVGRHLLARLGPSRADLPRIVDLLRAAPPRPDPLAYAALVLEASLRREVGGVGVLLRAGATAAVVEVTSTPMLSAAATVDGLLDAAAVRWRAATGEGRSPRAGVTGTAGVLSRCVAADRYLQAHPDPGHHEVADREADLLACLLAKPAHLTTFAPWLETLRLSGSWHPIQQAMLGLYEHGAQVDPVTVLAEAARRPGEGAPGATEVLARVEAVASFHPAYLAQLVAADQLLASAGHAAAELCAVAADLETGVPEILNRGRELTASLRRVSAPLEAEPRARTAVVHHLPTRQAHRAGPVAG